MYSRSCMWTRAVCLLVRLLSMSAGILEVNIDRPSWTSSETHSEVHVQIYKQLFSYAGSKKQNRYTKGICTVRT